MSTWFCLIIDYLASEHPTATSDYNKSCLSWFRFWLSPRDHCFGACCCGGRRGRDSTTKQNPCVQTNIGHSQLKKVFCIFTHIYTSSHVFTHLHAASLVLLASAFQEVTGMLSLSGVSKACPDRWWSGLWQTQCGQMVGRCLAAMERRIFVVLMAIEITYRSDTSFVAELFVFGEKRGQMCSATHFVQCCRFLQGYGSNATPGGQALSVTLSPSCKIIGIRRIRNHPESLFVEIVLPFGSFWQVPLTPAMDASELLGCFEQALPVSVVAEGREFAVLIGQRNAWNVNINQYQQSKGNLSKTV